MKITAKLTILCLLVASACGDDKKDDASSTATGDDAKLVQDATDKFKECDLFVEGVDDKDNTIEDDYDRCAAACVIEATCTDLRELRCSDEPTESELISCVFACDEAPADGYACKDGTKIAHAALCDGEDDCDDGGDEQNCEEYECADGETLELGDLECDGFEDCEDGSDEADCANICG